MQKSIHSIKKNDAARLARLFSSEYEAAPDEATKRLQALGISAVGWVLWIIARMPLDEKGVASVGMGDE